MVFAYNSHKIKKELVHIIYEIKRVQGTSNYSSELNCLLSVWSAIFYTNFSNGGLITCLKYLKVIRLFIWESN